jgi:RND family efflux transporter MFP subunit
MNRIQNIIAASLFAFVLPFSPQVIGEDHDAHEHAENEMEHEDDEHKKENGHEEETGIHLTVEQLQMGGIVSEALQLHDVKNEHTAPGEIQLNAYATSKVVPRVSAQILTRQARLGDKVKKGQVLVVLSSVEMAQAQGDFLVAEREWRRVKKLGRDIVSDQRYTKARIAREQASAKVRAYGMTKEELDKLLTNKSAEQAEGQLQLLAQQDGTVIRDDFVIGELVEPGRVLFEISDESNLWVEARLTPDQVSSIKIGAPAIVVFQGQQIQGKVIQAYHALYTSTRRLSVRIEIPNPDDQLHPGLFVETHIQGSVSEQALAIPNDAVLRSPDGDWQVFIEHEPGEFEPHEVEIVRSSSGLTVIEGLDPGTKVVTKGVFFLQSELAKSGFEIHNH